MKIDIYHIFKHFDNVNFIPPVIIDVLKVWSDKKGWNASARVAREKTVKINTNADVVAMSVYTQTADIAYRLSEELRKRGKIVILGGPHFRGPNYKEALPYCDVVVNTISERQWLELLEEIEKGNITPNSAKARYIVDAKNEFEFPTNLHTAFQEHRWYQIPSIPTTFGCPYDCEFCNAFMQGEYNKRDVGIIYSELENIKGKTTLISDASFGLHKQHTMEMMEAIAPLKKSLIIETTMARLKDRELLNKMAEGGVKIVSMGVETLSLKMGKHGSSSIEDTLDSIVKQCHDLGMIVQGNFIMGLDCDGPESFQAVYEYYKRTKLDFVFTDILTPYPNTPLYYRMKNAGRIIDDDWAHYDYRHVVYRPLNMSINQLMGGFIEMYKGITHPDFVWKKAKEVFKQRGLSIESLIVWSFNIFNRFDATRKEKDFKETIKLIDPGILDEIYQPPEGLDPLQAVGPEILGRENVA